MEQPRVPASVKEFLTYQEEEVIPAPTGRAKSKAPGSSSSTTPAEEPPTTTLVTKTRDKEEAYREFQAAFTQATYLDWGWQKQARCIEELKLWMESTIAQKYRDSCCQPTSTITIWYNNLQAKVKPEAEEETQILREDFKKMATPLRSPPRNWADWIDS